MGSSQSCQQHLISDLPLSTFFPPKSIISRPFQIQFEAFFHMKKGQLCLLWVGWQWEVLFLSFCLIWAKIDFSGHWFQDFFPNRNLGYKV